MTPETPDWAKTNFLGIAIAVFIVVMIIEMVRARKRNPGAYEFRDSAASFLMGTGSTISGAAYAGVHAAIFLAVYDMRLFDIGWTWPALIICFFAEDLVYYCGHRLSHEHRLWWATHVVHHSSQHMNGSTAFRQAWTSLLGIGVWTRLPLFFIGFPPAMVFMFTGITAAWQLWVHTEQVKKIGPFEWIFNTASHHRVHHATNPCYLDSNYGGFLIIWDRIFGTFIAERDDEPCRYGIISNLGTFNLFRIALHEWVAMVKDVANARSLRDVAGYVLGPPGWSPDGSRQTSRSIKAKWIEENQALVPAE